MVRLDGLEPDGFGDSIRSTPFITIPFMKFLSIFYPCTDILYLRHGIRILTSYNTYHIYIIIPGSSRYAKIFSLLVVFLSEFRHKIYTQKEDPGIYK